LAAAAAHLPSSTRASRESARAQETRRGSDDDKIAIVTGAADLRRRELAKYQAKHGVQPFPAVPA
jgi:hypothetical protein